MKQFLIILLIITITLGIFTPTEKSLASLFRPFGGKVIMNIQPPIICPGEGPITIRPIGFSPPTPYSVTPGTRRFLYYSPAPGSWILGLYAPLSPICFIPTPLGPIPIPALPIILFGASRPGL